MEKRKEYHPNGELIVHKQIRVEFRTPQLKDLERFYREEDFDCLSEALDYILKAYFKENKKRG